MKDNLPSISCCIIPCLKLLFDVKSFVSLSFKYKSIQVDKVYLVHMVLWSSLIAVVV